MLNIAAIVKQSVSVEFEYAGEKVNAQILPHKLTATYQARLEKVVSESDAEIKSVDARLVADVLESWDVENDGQPFPPTYDNLLNIPRALLTKTAMEILSQVGKQATQGESKD